MASRRFDHPASFVLLVHEVAAGVRSGAEDDAGWEGPEVEARDEVPVVGARDAPGSLECEAALGVPVPQPARSTAVTAAAVLSLRAVVARPGRYGGAVALVRSRYDGTFIAQPPSTARRYTSC